MAMISAYPAMAAALMPSAMASKGMCRKGIIACLAARLIQAALMKEESEKGQGPPLLPKVLSGERQRQN
jgi:hypothetical protein